MQDALRSCALYALDKKEEGSAWLASSSRACSNVEGQVILVIVVVVVVLVPFFLTGSTIIDLD